MATAFVVFLEQCESVINLMQTQHEAEQSERSVPWLKPIMNTLFVPMLNLRQEMMDFGVFCRKSLMKKKSSGASFCASK